MPADNYRAYLFDGAGRLHGPMWFAAGSDEQAVSRIEAFEGGGIAEIWLGNRLVASLPTMPMAA